MASGKSRVGRPPKYKTVEDMQAKIDAYFTACEGTPLLDDEGKAVTDKYGEPVIVGAHRQPSPAWPLRWVLRGVRRCSITRQSPNLWTR